MLSLAFVVIPCACERELHDLREMLAGYKLRENAVSATETKAEASGPVVLPPIIPKAPDAPAVMS